MSHRYASSLLRALLAGGLTVVLASSAAAQTTTVLRAGDLVFTGVNTADDDEFTFAPLVNLAAGTQIQFTDNGWLAAGGFRATEGVATYTAPTAIAKGTLLRFTRTAGLSSAGFSATGQFLLAADGDQVIAYQGPANNPTLVSALTTKAWAADATSAGTSALPSGLVAGSTALVVPRYNAYMSQAGQRRGPAAQLRQWFATPASWTNPRPNGSTRCTWMATAPFNQNLQVEAGVVPDADELLALQALYTSTGGPNWTTRTNWPTTPTPWPATLSSVNFATWFGITVVNGDVTAVQLSSNHLVGTLPVELGKLAQLRTLRLHDNALGGGLPDELGQAAGLQTLDVSANQFTGDFPPVVVGLRQLQELSLYNNQFSGILPADLGQCRQLVYLQLNNNRLTGTVPASLGRLARLNVLFLDYNQLSGSLPDSLARLTALTELILRGNQFSGPIPAGWQQLTQLTALRLENNRLTGPVPAAIATLPNLYALSVAHNRLTGSIPAFLSAGSGGGFADFSDNDFTGLVPYTAVANAGTKTLLVQNNRLDFGALEPSFTPAGASAYAGFTYSPQRAQTPADTARYVRGGTLQIHRQPTGAYNNLPQWEREVGSPGAAIWTAVPGANSNDYVLPNATEAAQGLYRLALTNTRVPGLTLYLRAAYADLVPYAPLPENRSVDVGPQALATAFAPSSRGAATDSVNYVRTFSARAAYTDPARLVQAVVDSVQVRTEYLDGLGRPVQTVLRQESPGRRDLVQPVAYDALGRQPRQYLPYVAANPTGTAGDYRPDAVYAQYHFYRDNLTGPGVPTDGVVRTGVPFGETAFEASPLNRVLAQAAAGESWQLATGRVVSRLERPNTAADSVQYFVPGYGPNSADLTAQTGGYAAGELWGTQTTDEQVGPDGTGYRTLEWKDKLGQTVLKQVEAKRVGTGTAARSRWLRTYYVADDFGHLRAVLPPEAVKAMQANAWAVNAAAEKFLFRYRYDGRGRVIAKQVPGTEGETWVVYDQLDRPVLTQDAAQRQRREWSVTKYDALGRVVLTGLAARADTAGQVTLQAQAAANTGTDQQYEVRTADAAYPEHYTYAQSYPRVGQQGFVSGQVLTATYYDDYDFNNDGTADVAYDPQLDAQLAVAPVPDNRTTGQLTRTLTRVLGVAAAAPGAWLTATTFYDEHARPVQVQSTNARGGQDLVTSQLDFTGKVLKSVALHHGPSLPAAGLQVAETMTYDHAGRLLATRQQLPGEAQPALIASLVYNELGQLTRKSIGTGALLQNVDYAYNVRGWLTGLNDPSLSEPSDLFGLALCYERGFTGTYEQYNGNITGQKWRSKRDGVERAYGYAYDPLNRLLQGDYVARAGTTATAPWTAEAGNYRLYGVSYDGNGNILTLRRRGLLAQATRLAPKQYGPVDLLNYRYDGNRLQAVDDQVTTNQLPRPTGYNGAPTSLAGDFQEQGVRQGQEYYYDANGSMTQDRNKGITGIAYNHLNLPKQIRFGTGADSLVFRYTAAGQKVAKLVYQTGKPLLRTDYLGPYQYEQDSLRFFPHAEGRVLRFVNGTSGAVRYAREFTLQDHLGNLRVAFRAQAGTEDLRLSSEDPAQEEGAYPKFENVATTQSQAIPAYHGSYSAAVTNAQNGPAISIPVAHGDHLKVRVRCNTPYGVQYFRTAPVESPAIAPRVAVALAPLLLPVSTGPSPDGRPAPRVAPGLQFSLSGLLSGLSSRSRTKQAAFAAKPAPPTNFPLNAYMAWTLVNNQGQIIRSGYQLVPVYNDGQWHPLDLPLDIDLSSEEARTGTLRLREVNDASNPVFFDSLTITRPQDRVLVSQENHYYPFGMALSGVAVNTAAQPQVSKDQFNGGSELQDELLGSEAGVYSTFYRNYDPATGRFQGVDPLAGKYASESPYSFSFNDPVNYNDPIGAEPIIMNGRVMNMRDVVTGMPTWGGSDLEYTMFQQGGPGISVGGNPVMTRNDGSIGYYTSVPGANGSSGPGNIHQVNELGNVSVSVRFISLSGLQLASFNYADGWLNKGSAFDETETSESIGLFGHMVGSLEASLVVEMGRTTSIAKIASLDRAVAISKVAGNSLGFIGAGFTLYENATDANGLSVGDVAKVALGVGMMFTPVGLVFGVADLAVGLATGVTLSDRVGAGIDQMLGSRAYHPFTP